MTPAQIEAQEKRADELISALSNPTGQGKDGSDPGQDRATPNAQGQREQSQTESQQRSKDVTQRNEDSYRDRYMTLQGKYNAEVPRLQQQLQDMTSKVRDLETRLSQQGDAKTPSSQEPGSNKETSSFDLDEVGEYGDDFRKMGETLLAVQKENAQLRDQLQSLGQSFQQTQTQTAHNSYLDRVAGQLSKVGQDLQQLNRDPKLLDWLKQPDGMSGQTRHDSLRKAQAAQDVDLTIKIFRAFLGDSPTHQQAKQHMPNVQPPQHNTGSDISPQQGQQGRMWSRSDISQFYRDKTLGKYGGEEGRKRAAAIEADIFAAQREGRISP